MPMVALPRQWRRYNSGGYYYLPGTIMRVRGSKEQRDMLKEAGPQQLSKVFEVRRMGKDCLLHRSGSLIFIRCPELNREW